MLFTSFITVDKKSNFNRTRFIAKRCGAFYWTMRRLLIIGTFCLLTTYSFGQKTDLICKEVKGVKSKIIDNKNIGVMDTVLFLVRGQITKRNDVEDYQNLKGINVTLTNINGGQSIGATTDENGNFKIWGVKGTYNLDVTYIGLDKLVIKKLRIGSGEIRLINVVLGPGTYYEMTEK